LMTKVQSQNTVSDWDTTEKSSIQEAGSGRLDA
jgi:hypothetical protein